MNIKDFKASLDYMFEAQLTPFVWGHAGIGKSQSIKQYALSKGYKFFPFYLGTMSDTGDILGLASFVKDKHGNEVATRFATPQWLLEMIEYCENNPKSGAIIFLDEFNRARRDVLNGMFSLALDKTFHTVSLPKNCHVVAAGNPPTDEYCVTDVNETALMARFVHIKLEPTFNEWVDYAKAKEIEPTLISFLREQPNLLEDNRSAFNLPVKVDRRSYEHLNRLHALKTPPELLDQLASGIIGTERLVAYKAHLKTSEKPLTAEEILKGKGVDKIKDWSNPSDIKSALLSNTCDNLQEHFVKLDSTNATGIEGMENLVTFCELLPKEVAFSFFYKLFEKDNKSIKLVYDSPLYTKRLQTLVKGMNKK